MKKVLLTLIASFAFCGSIFAQAYWPDINSSNFNDHDPIVAMVSLDNNLFLPTDNYANIEVAAFVDVNGNEDYRGHGFLNYYSEYDDPYPVLEFEIYNQPLENENESSIPVHFKMYDHGTGTLYDYCTCDVDIVTLVMYNTYNFSLMPTLSFFHTFTKEITPYSGNGGYCFIASPLGMEVSPTDVNNMTDNTFDLYRFNQSAELEWENWKQAGDNFHFNLEPGKGYLYANSGDGTNNPVVLTFIGAPYDGEGEVELVYDGDAEFPGWNLVGNPFAQTAYISKSFYTLHETENGSEVVAGEGNEVGAMEGIFVVAEEGDGQMAFSTTPLNAKGQIVLNVKDRENTIDRAIVRFGGDMLPKFMLNQNNAKLYISKDGDDFAVVRGNRSGSLPVNFEPAEDGTYVISGRVQNMQNVRYLHLIDNELGIDIDLLRTPNYKFDAKKVDRADRFVLVFSTNVLNTMAIKGGDRDDFGFFSNGNWIISNEGDAILQVIDVNGRILSSEEISGCVSKRIEAAPGVYVLRLINGKDVKVQKVVIE